MIVVDVGCHPHGSEESVYKLVNEYHPEVLFGFDPFPGLVPGMERYPEEAVMARSARLRRELRFPTTIFRARLAAWLHNGFVPYEAAEMITAGIAPATSTAPVVPCFDLVAWLKTLPMPDVSVILKLDCEGAEYPLLRAIVDADLDLLLTRVVVEWHTEDMAHGHFDKHPARVRCPVEDWDDW